MGVRELIKRYVIFAIGMIFIALGIVVTTMSMLGTSPISAIPYSLSMAFPALTLGNWTIIFNALLVFAQLLILRKDAKIMELGIQFVINIPFGYVIDLWRIILPELDLQTYPLRIIVMIIGCFIVAFGVYFQLLAEVVMLPGDAFVRAIAKVVKKEFGKIRTISDISMTVIAFAIVLLFTGGLCGMREGTVIAAFLVGNIVRVYKRALPDVWIMRIE